jgi:hypothetical protein
MLVTDLVSPSVLFNDAVNWLCYITFVTDENETGELVGFQREGTYRITWINTCPNDIFSDELARDRSRTLAMTAGNQQPIGFQISSYFPCIHCAILGGSFTCRTH